MEPNHQGDVTIILQNCSDQDIEIPRNTTLGYLEIYVLFDIGTVDLGMVDLDT